MNGLILAVLTIIIIYFSKKYEYYTKVEEFFIKHFDFLHFKSEPNHREGIEETKEKQALYEPDKEIDFGNIFDKEETDFFNRPRRDSVKSSNTLLSEEHDLLPETPE